MESSQAGQQLLFLLVVLVGFAILVVRPQRARARAQREVRARLAPGVQVMTTAGLYAAVVEAGDDVVLLEIAPGVRARFDTRAVARVVEPDAPGGPTTA